MSSGAEPLFDLPEPGRSAVGRGRWILSAAAPAERRHHIERQLGPWVTWLVHTYRLRTVIPPCWYRHPDIVERLKNLMAGWIATFTDDPADHLTDRPFAYVEFDDALERELHRITVPPTCLDGDHNDPPTTWATDTGQSDWLTTSTWATAPATHPTPEFADTTSQHPADRAADRTEATMTDQPSTSSGSIRPGQAGASGLVMPRAHGENLVKDGHATAMRDYAIHYDGAWWLGDGTTYVRVTDDELNHKLDFKAIKLARADQAVARTQQARTDEPGEHHLSGVEERPEDKPSDTGQAPSDAGTTPHEPDDQPDDPGEAAS